MKNKNDNVIDFYYLDKKVLETFLSFINEKKVIKIIDVIIDVLKIDYVIEIDITMTNDAESLILNKKYRNQEYIPDVISFNGDFYDSKKKYRLLGDLYLNIFEMQRKIHKSNNSLICEFSWCLIHGILHLFDYDHEQNSDESKKMFDLTDEILSRLDLKYNF